MMARLAANQAQVSDVERPRALEMLAIVEGLAATAAMILIGRAFPVRDVIAVHLPGASAEVGLILGVAFWIAFGLFGSLRAGPRAGGSVLTFSTPFIVAGIVLGGPFVGVLMGLLAEFEPRELKLPWYGVVTNHANVILSAAAAGLIGGAFREVYEPWFGGSAALGLATTVITAFVFTALNTALVVPVLAFRTGASLVDASRSYRIALRRTAVAETILAWLMATVYVVVGWWAPMACVALVVVIWRFQAQQDALIRDPRTGLLNDLGFLPIAEGALRASRAGRRSDVLLFFDLDSFSAVNNAYGQEAGDEVIAAVARRVQTAVRGTDIVARRNRAGDEFLVLYDGVASEELALRLAWRLHERIVEPITLRGTGTTVSVGASIGLCMLARDPVVALDAALMTAEHRAHLAKRRLYGDEGRAAGMTSGGVGPLDPLPGAIAAFRHDR
jgi:diguanylate cyclase (GGDEF)-like protein